RMNREERERGRRAGGSSRTPYWASGPSPRRPHLARPTQPAFGLGQAQQPRRAPKIRRPADASEEHRPKHEIGDDAGYTVAGGARATSVERLESARPMTVCIAALCQEDGKPRAVVGADRMVTLGGFIEFEHAVPKIGEA